MFEVNDVLKNKHTGVIVLVNDMVTGGENYHPIFCVELLKTKGEGGFVFRFNNNHTKYWEIVGDEEE